MPRILLIAGSSGGHLMPVIAVAEELRALSANIEIRIVCTPRGTDQEELRRRHLPFSVLPVLRARWSLPWAFLRTMLAARSLLRKFHPDALFSKGGATGLPLCLLAQLKGIPLIIHESDAVMGRANRLLQRFASVVCVEFPTAVSGKRLAVGRCIVTGNPIRSEISRGSREEGLQITGFSGKRPILLVLGGSQGAETFNRIVIGHQKDILACCDVIHLTGPGKDAAPAHPGYWARPFVHEELPHLYACAALAVSRAGAGTISELASCGLPAILVPLKGLAQDHQMKNARRAEQTGGCMILQQEICNEELVPTIRQIIADDPRRSRMAQAMRSTSHLSAARHIAKIILQKLASAA